MPADPEVLPGDVWEVWEDAAPWARFRLTIGQPCPGCGYIVAPHVHGLTPAGYGVALLLASFTEHSYRLISRLTVPSWVDAHLPPCGPCLLCGGPDARHRVLDAIASRLAAGEDLESVVDDYGYPAEFINRIHTEWSVA